ncbi:thiol protease/hemagglutinin PrtT [Bacteroidales bacterium OttesenSCG-928-J19]|nr:thiol protease/hemagglutinin PrtT [Bacteroidales bacterium OttesenSCG-928-J19]
MKKNLLLILIFCIGISFSLLANPRDLKDAIRIGTEYMENSTTNTLLKSNSMPVSLKPAYICENTNHPEEGIGYYYILNDENNNSFVIVSGDDRTKDVLGYSNQGKFDPNNIPDNLKYWLDCYQEELENIPDTYSSSYTVHQNTYATSIPPLLTCKWDQGAPYNNLCPSVNGTKTVTGCVATAMAQIMKYHKWPTSYNFYQTYYTNTHNLLVGGGYTGEYNWDIMLDNYSGLSPETANEQVANLMLHCGLLVEMDYNTPAVGGSGAATMKVANALSSYLGYDKGHDAYMRDFCSITEWINVLKEELNNNRPVLYSGQSSSGGHAFVCDGYDENGLFHFNWGWSGHSDGYYQISALNPGSVGIGGSSSGYNASQSILVGIQKTTQNSKRKPYKLGHKALDVDKETISYKEEPASLRATNLQNLGTSSFYGDLGVMLLDEKGELVDYKTTYNYKSVGEFEVGTYYPNIPFSYTIPENIPNGKYRLKLAYRLDSSTPPVAILGRIVSNDYLDVTISNSTATITVPNVTPELNTGNILANWFAECSFANFKVELVNPSEKEYNSKLAFYLEGITDTSIQGSWVEYPVCIPPQSIYIFTVNDVLYPKFKAGRYKLYLRYDPSNNKDNSSTLVDLNSFDIQVLPEGSVNIDDIDTDNITIYPNPIADGILYINSKEWIKTLSVYNTTGQLWLTIYPSQSGEISVPVDNLPSGLYILQIETEIGMKTQKFNKR